MINEEVIYWYAWIYVGLSRMKLFISGNKD